MMPTNKLFSFNFILLFFLSLPICAQTPSFYHYSSSDGLASATVYDIIQDKDGFIWFGTANGVSKFDGKHFTNFRMTEGLNSNSIISLAEGNDGDLYIGNFEKGINIFRNGRIENFCSDIAGKRFALSFLMLVPSNKKEQKFFVYNRWGNINIITKKKSAGPITSSINTFPVLINKLEFLQDGTLLALTTKGLFVLKDKTLSKLQVSGFPDTDVYCLTHDKNGGYFIGTKRFIYQIKNNSVIGKHKINIAGKNDVVAILRDRNNNIWFSIMNRGFYLIPNGSNIIIDVGSKMDLQKTLVNRYFEDKEGNVWLSTFGKGVYCINNLYLQNYSEKDGLSSNNVYSIAQEKSGKLLLGTFNGINVLQNGEFDQIKNNSGGTITDYIYSIQNYDDEFFVNNASGKKGITTIPYKGIKLFVFEGLSFCKLKNGLFLFGTRVNSIKVQRKFTGKNSRSDNLYLFGDSSNANRVNQIFEDSGNNIWVGTSLGLCKLTFTSNDVSKWRKTFFPSNQILNSRIQSIFQSDKDNVWFAGEKGIACYNLENDSISTYTNYMGYDLSSSTSLASDNKNRLWIGNMKGLFLFERNSIKQLNSQTGLPSNEVFSLSFNKAKNILYVGTSNGLARVDINLFDNDIVHAPQIKIMSVKAGDSIYTKFNNLVLNPEQDHVYIDFNALSFSSPGSVRYKYLLNGQQTETDHDFLDLVSLRPGTYQLKVTAKAQNTEWGKAIFISFQILPRFIETIWFSLIIILLVFSLSVLLIIWRLRVNTTKIKNELELTERINELKHQALSAMMNPHFIFNSLNSVQYLINSQRNEEANDYIAMMAKLIRKNLDTAGNGFILLSEEINRLKLYLELEKLRFQEQFSYEIIAIAGVHIDALMIPNMIIQPFVENTLWHGIINSGVKGKITISFSFEDVDIDSVICKSLIIRITDNGIGINRAKKNKKDDHISKGIQIIEERLRLLSAKMEIPKPIILDDLSNRNDNSHGTEVIISLPPHLYKIINSK